MKKLIENIMEINKSRRIYKYNSKFRRWMGDLELSSIIFIYDVTLIVFNLNDKNEITIYNIYGDIQSNKIILNLILINNNHFAVLYENNLIENNKNKKIKYNIKEEISRINNNIKKKVESVNLNFKYANDYRRYSYNDIINYLNNKGKNNKQLYPNEIYQIKCKSKRKDKKNLLENSLINIILIKKPID